MQTTVGQLPHAFGFRGRTSSCWGVAMVSALLAIAVQHPALSQEIILPQAPAMAPDRLEPQRSRTEFETDRIHATALFAEGRVLFRHDKFDEALSKYQRAYRYSRRATTILDEIVPLAFRLGRVDQAIRYVEFADERSRIDPFILRRLAILLTEREEFAEALRLYALSIRESQAGSEGAGVGLITDFEMGRLSFLVDDYQQSAERFARVLAIVDKPNVTGEDKIAVDALMKEASATLALIAEVYLEAGRLGEAETLFRRALTKPKQAPMLRYNLARIAFEQGEFDRAHEELDRYFESKSDAAGTAPYELLERLLAKQGQEASLVERLRSLRETQPSNLFVGYFLADKLLKADESNEAIPVFEELIADRPLLDAYRGLLVAYYRESRHAKFCLLLADAIDKLDGVTEVQATLKPMIADDEFMKRVFSLSKDPQLFGKSDSRELRSNSRALAHLALLRNDFDLADQYFAVAVGKKNPNTTVWLNWSIEQMIADRLDAAVKNLDSLASQQLPDNEAGMVQYYRAGALALSDQTAAALKAAEVAQRKLPKVPSIELRRAWALSLGRRWPDARRAYRAFLERYGDEFGSGSLREVVREAKSNLSTIEVELGDAAAAEEWMEQVLDVFPSDVGTMNDLGYLWADRGVHLQKALSMIEEATKAEPDNYAYRDSLGWVLFQLGRFDEAVVELRLAITNDEPDGVVLDHLGDAIEATEGAAAARPYWTRALKRLKESNPELSARIQAKIDSKGGVE